MECFEYRPLNPKRNEIRLLRPSVVQDTSPGQSRHENELNTRPNEDGSCNDIVTPDLSLEFTLETVSLDDKPAYTALSYVWGKETDEKGKIRVDGSEFPVGKNLDSALRHMAFKNIAPAMWIDAISINQSDVSEKSDQVPRMRSIYSGASNVMIWLGPATEDSEAMSSFLGSFDRMFRERFNVPNPPKYAFIDYAEFDSEDALLQFLSDVINDTPQAASAFPSIPSFFEKFTTFVVTRPWWYRAWILQEFVLAPSLFFQSGRYKLLFEALSTLIALTVTLQSAAIAKFNLLPGSPQNTANALNFQQILYMHVYRELHQEKRRKVPTLYEMLCMTHCRSQWKGEIELGASDDRDRIYALAGLVGEDFDALGLIVDYGKQCYEIYAEVAEKLIRSGNLDILALCRRRTLTEDVKSEASPETKDNSGRRLDLHKLPSWAPDWSRSILLPTTWWKQGQGEHRVLGNGLYKAGADTSVEAKFAMRQDEQLGHTVFSVHLRGVFVDEVMRVMSLYPRSATTSPEDTPRLYASLGRDIRELCELSAHGSYNVYSGMQLREAAWRIPISDHENPTDDDMPAQRATHLSEERYMQCLPVFEAMEDFMNAKQGKQGGSFAKPLSMLQNASADAYIYLLSMAAGYPIRPFITTKGYIGLGPENIESGDTVCVFHGARAPHILSTSGNQGAHKLVGQAFVYGIMDGEVIAGSRESQDFEIY